MSCESTMEVVPDDIRPWLGDWWIDCTVCERMIEVYPTIKVERILKAKWSVWRTMCPITKFMCCTLLVVVALALWACFR